MQADNRIEDWNMCGGIVYNMMKLPRVELQKVYDDDQIKIMEKSGTAQSLFWDKRPVLPVEEGGQLRLIDWGNRDKEINLPKTGWAKRESIDAGKWAYLKPKIVLIPALRGYEKGVWFDIEGRGIEGLVIKRDGQERAYVITKESDSEYLKLTKHNRQPCLIR